MEAPTFLQQEVTPRKSPISKSGVLVVRGFGLKLQMRFGQLEVEDGIGRHRRKFRLARVGCGLHRLICISEDGFITLSALKWVSDVGASFAMLSHTGKLLFATGPTAPGDSRLRRIQSFAMLNGRGLEICRALIDAKLRGQERVARERLNDGVTSEAIAGFRNRLSSAGSIEEIRWLESRAAISYFGAVRNVRVFWPKKDLRRIPQYWQTAGSRHSPVSGSPRRAIVAVGLDPALGLGLHTDNPDRDSLVFDVLEAVRPEVEDWVLAG